jgi:hypothetical protein
MYFVREGLTFKISACTYVYTFQQKERVMSVSLAEHYSSLSIDNCLGLGERRGHGGGLTEDPLVDLPLVGGQGASFALPPGVQVR